MESSIKIDYVYRGKEKGMQPCIHVILSPTDDPRDKLLEDLFFQSPWNEELPATLDVEMGEYYTEKPPRIKHIYLWAPDAAGADVEK